MLALTMEYFWDEKPIVFAYDFVFIYSLLIDKDLIVYNIVGVQRRLQGVILLFYSKAEGRGNYSYWTGQDLIDLC